MNLCRLVITISMFGLMSVASYSQSFPGWFTYDTLSSPLRSNLITSIAIAHDRTVWIGTSAGLASLSEQLNWTLYDTSNSPLTSNWIKCLQFDPNNTLWIGTLQDGLFGFFNGSWTHYHTGNTNWLTNNISAVARRKNGDLWVGTHGQGAYVLTNNNWQNWRHQNTGIDIDFINDIDTDDSNNVWLATHNGGLVKISDLGWISYNQLNTNFSTNHVQAVCVENNRYVWTGLNGPRPDSALLRLDLTDQSWIIFDELSTLDEGIRSVWDIYVDMFGRKWIATNELTRGVWLYNDTSFINYSAGFSGLASNRVFAVRERQDTSYWFATLSGLSFFKPSLTSFSEFDNSLSPVMVGPNPCMDYLSVSFTVPGIKSFDCSVLDASGRVVFSNRSISGSKFNLNVSHLTQGIYFIEIKESHRKSVLKILKV